MGNMMEQWITDNLEQIKFVAKICISFPLIVLTIGLIILYVLLWIQLPIAAVVMTLILVFVIGVYLAVFIDEFIIDKKRGD